MRPEDVEFMKQIFNALYCGGMFLSYRMFCNIANGEGMTNTWTIPVTIFGGGKIACGRHLKGASQPLSHMAAVTATDNLYIHAIIEQNQKRQSEIEQDWPDTRIYNALANVPPINMKSLPFVHHQRHI